MSETNAQNDAAAAAPAAVQAPTSDASRGPVPGGPERDGEVLATIKAPGSQPLGLTFDGESLWCADRKDRKIYKLNPETGQVTFTIAFDGDLTGTAWDGEYIWQADQQSRTISRIHPETGQIDRTIKVDLANGDIAGICYEQDTANEPGGLWYALSRLGQARKVKPEDGAFMRGYPTHADVCGIVPTAKHLFYTEPSAGLLHKVHALAGSLIISYRVGGKPTGIALTDRGFWVACQENQTISLMRF